MSNVRYSNLQSYKSLVPTPLLAPSFLSPLVATFLLLVPGVLSAEPIPVRYLEGTVHGFLALRSIEDKLLASGDLTQVVRGNRVSSRLVFRFKDGSIDDESAIFSQRGHFRLISDHHIQKGPAFKTPTDLLIKASTGDVTVRSVEKGKEKVIKEHLDLPPDLANGLILNVLKNVQPETTETKMTYLAATPKPKIVKLSVARQGEEKFYVAGLPHKASRFLVKVELGGIAGVLAPLVGKQPDNISVWVLTGEAPAFIRSEGPMYLGGPSWTIEMTSPFWRQGSGHAVKR